MIIFSFFIFINPIISAKIHPIGIDHQIAFTPNFGLGARE